MSILNKNFKSIAQAALVILIAASCTKNFDELNTNPGLISEKMIKADNLFSRVQKISLFAIPEFGRVSEFAGFMSNESSGFPFQNEDYGDPFTGYYRSYLSNINEVIRLTQNPAQSNKNAMARIFRVWLFHNLTDSYGDIPYFEAAKSGDAFVASPKYDKQEDIYKDMLKELKEAEAQLTTDPSQENYGNADLLYGGDIEAWKKLANSLRLRLAVRVRYVDNTLAQQNISEVISQPLISVNEENAKLLSDSKDAPNRDNRSPIINSINDGVTLGNYFSFTVLEVLAVNNDPRMHVYFQLPKEIDATSSIPYRARPINPSGPINARYSRDSVSFIGAFFEASRFTFNMLTAAEVSFLKAEAVLEGLANGDANALYRDGIRRAMEQYNVPETAINNFMAESVATLNGTNEQKLEQIIVQKYIALVYESTEAWTEYRRTGYPKMWLGSGPTDTDGKVPRRLTYPSDEYSKNGTNVNEAVTRYPGGDKLTSRMWWDAKTGVPYVHPRQNIYPPESW